jgi:hypothetical protein
MKSDGIKLFIRRTLCYFSWGSRVRRLLESYSLVRGCRFSKVRIRTAHKPLIEQLRYKFIFHSSRMSISDKSNIFITR